MYDPSHYTYDATNQLHEASIADGGILFRIASLTHSGPADVLSGRGPVASRSEGRFHVAQQPTSYCSNNFLVALAEVLFHQYRTVLTRIRDRQPYRDVFEACDQQRCLSVFRVSQIDGLLFVDSDAARADFDEPRICGANVVFPDLHYEPFQALANKLRAGRLRGVVYPSARHSRDICLALFDDETHRVRADLFEKLILRIRLVREDQDPLAPPVACNPMKHKVHSTMGYYEFMDETLFDKLSAAGIIYPYGLKSRGMIDFVRRWYRNYPSDATL